MALRLPEGCPPLKTREQLPQHLALILTAATCARFPFQDILGGRLRVGVSGLLGAGGAAGQLHLPLASTRLCVAPPGKVSRNSPPF